MPGGCVHFGAGPEEECPEQVGPEEAQVAQEVRAALGPLWEGPRWEALPRRSAGLAALTAGLVPGRGGRCDGEELRLQEAAPRHRMRLPAAGFRRGAAPASAAPECCRGSVWGGGERVYV